MVTGIHVLGMGTEHEGGVRSEFYVSWNRCGRCRQRPQSGNFLWEDSCSASGMARSSVLQGRWNIWMIFGSRLFCCRLCFAVVESNDACFRR